MSIKSLFEQQSDNLSHNFEKIKAHFNLCFFHTDPEFKTKIQKKTQDIISTIIKHNSNRLSILETIEKMPDNIFEVYLNFFKVLQLNTSILKT